MLLLTRECFKILLREQTQKEEIIHQSDICFFSVKQMYIHDANLFKNMLKIILTHVLATKNQSILPTSVYCNTNRQTVSAKE